MVSRNLRFLSLAAAVLLIGCVDEPTAAPDAGEFAPLQAAVGTDDAVPNQYVVVFKSGAGDVGALARDMVKQAGGTLRHTYSHSLRGFAANLSPQALDAIRRHPQVAYLAQDRIAATTVAPPSWGLDRVDQRNLPLDGNAYTYGAFDGSGVTIYGLDTGVRITHNDFGGRASHGWDFVSNDPIADDCNGHGTHTMGTAAGTTFGTAPGANVVAVRVLDCGGSAPYSTVIAGVDWVTNNFVAPAVANMSLGGGFFQPMNDAVEASSAAGVSYAISSGNSNTNACSFSPASSPSAVTVNATATNDNRSFYSNYGNCTDIFAPGDNIVSAWYTSNTATATLSGTSMAAPHVAGTMAMMLQRFPTILPMQVHNRTKALATKNIVGNPGAGSPNNFVYQCKGVYMKNCP